MKSLLATAIAGLFIAAGVASGSAAGVGAPADGTTLTLPAPVTTLPTFPNLGLRPDRRLVSHVPGQVRTHEDVAIAMRPDGAPASVVLDERLHLSGTGAYLIYERGPARAASPIGDSLPPVLELGTVVWQGFSPGGRDLAARLRLDAALEAQRLPVTVSLSWRPATGGRSRALGVGGEVPGAGAVTVHVANTTRQPRGVPSGTVAPQQLVAPLTTLLAAARRSAAAPSTAIVLPTAGQGLPRGIAATGVVTQSVADVAAPMRLVGSITSTAAGSTLRGPTATSIPGGGRVAGVLTGSVDFTLNMPSAGRVAINLVANPSLDERTLRPPSGNTWPAWAQGRPSAAAAHAATDQLVAAAGAAAKGAEISPYIGSDTTGPATTTFRYTIAPRATIVTPARPLHPHGYAIGLVAFAGLTVVGGAVALWRRS
jgi:hypothetical protein